ncbi:hypothetical protein SAMN06309944_0337 [Micrococcales bacterium KH10]|nr:hypothetical protein SAMN06309944_0337 [Micrococcales bacterium KH10]
MSLDSRSRNRRKHRHIATWLTGLLLIGLLAATGSSAASSDVSESGGVGSEPVLAADVSADSAVWSATGTQLGLVREANLVSEFVGGGERAKEATVTSSSELSAVLLDDYREIARVTGRSLDETILEGELSDLFIDAVTEISEQFPHLVASEVWRSDDVDAPRITFVEKPPKSVISKLKHLPFAVEMRYGARLNEHDVADISGLVMQEISSRIGKDRDIFTSFDESDGSIKVAYERPQDLAKYGRFDARDVLRDIAGQYRGALPTDISIEPLEPSTGKPASPEANVRGGYQLTKAGSVPECTSGFSASRGGVQGVVTAGHCANSLYWNGQNNVISYVTQYPGSTSNYTLDLQFHKSLSGHATQAKFRADIGDVRNVNAIKKPVVGADACRFGMTTKRHCSTIHATQACVYYSNLGLRFCYLAVSKAYTSDFGDSGGPWYKAKQAMGTHTGSIIVNNDGVLRSAATSIVQVKNALGANVLTSG